MYLTQDWAEEHLVTISFCDWKVKETAVKQIATF